MRSADLRRASGRVRLVGAALLLAFGLLAVRAAHLSVIDDRGRRLGEAQTGTVLRLAPARGTVVDRHGAALAVTIPAPSIYAVPREVDDASDTARQLARALGRGRGTIAKRLGSTSPFTFVARWVTPQQARDVEALDLPGVGIVEEPRRAYPHGDLAGRLIGFANIDAQGVRGIEQREDAFLSGDAQRVAIERDARRQLLAKAGLDPRTAAGGDVMLTLDATLQSEVEGDLREVVKATGALGGLVVVLEIGTGNLRAVAEYPSFDPNGFRTARYRDTRSRAFLDASEAGSTLKAISMAAALEHRVVELDEKIDCEDGAWYVPGKTIHDTHRYGLLDPTSIIQVSSNICTAKLAFRVGPERHHAMLSAFGFGRASGSGFPDESAGLLRDAARWRPVDHANIAFGQGVNVTAIQLAAAFAAIADDGVWRQPRLIEARRPSGGDWNPAAPSHGQRVVRPDVARTVLGMLETVVSEEGTARRAGLAEVRVAGKTGTAQKLDLDTGTYSQSRYQAWFVGMAPADAPRHVVAVMVDEPAGRSHTGGAVAAPLFARASAASLGREGIVTAPVLPLPAFARIDEVRPPKRKPKRNPQPETKPQIAAAALPPVAAPAPAQNPGSVRDASGGVAAPAAPAPRPPRRSPRLVAIPQLGDRVLLPDFRGLTPEEVRMVTANTPVAVDLRGTGEAVAQDPAPGTILGIHAARVSVRFGGGEH